MKNVQLARIMVLVGGLGWALVLVAACFWWLGRVELSQADPRLLIFLSCLLGGCFLEGLCQAWLAVFAWLTGRTLPPPHDRGSALGILFGGLGWAITVLLVGGVLRSGAASDLRVVVSISLVNFLTLVAVLLAFQLAWIRRFDRRSEMADGARL